MAYSSAKKEKCDRAYNKLGDGLKKVVMEGKMKAKRGPGFRKKVYGYD